MNGTVWYKRPGHLVLGGAATLALVLATAVFSARPVWQSLPENHALLRLSFTHSGVRNCRDRTDEELAALPRNMRSTEICDRRRALVRVELDIDGGPVFAADLRPSGLAGSGPSRAYERFELPAGWHSVALRLRDDPAKPGFTHLAKFDFDAVPGESIAIDFDAAGGGFFLH